MSKRRRQDEAVCHDCRLIQLREGPEGKVVYWCAKKRRRLSPAQLMGPVCRHFKPLAKDGD